MKPISKLSDEELEHKLETYRQYFIDPNGSNAKEVADILSNTVTKMLKWYTGTATATHVKKVYDEPQHNFKNSSTKKQIKFRINSIGNTMPEEGASIKYIALNLSDLLQSEIKFNNRFMGQMHPHGAIPALAAGIAGKIINGNTIAEEVSPVTTNLEIQTIEWLAKLFGYNPTQYAAQTISNNVCSGNMCVGGTTANLAAMIVARNKAFGDASKNGLKEKGVIIGSEYAHYSLPKLCGYIGLGENNFLKIGTHKLKISPTKDYSLEKELWTQGNSNTKVVAVVAIAGTTETGDIDDIEGIANTLDKFEKKFGYRPHFHVDAAHGGGFIMHDEYNYQNGKFKGIDRADSITIDPHKMLYAPYNAGMILFKNQKDHALLKQNASYLFKNNGDIDLGAFRVEGSLGLEGTLQTHANLQYIGKKGFEVIQEHTIRLTKHLESLVKTDSDYELMNEPDMNLLCFRYNNPKLSQENNNKINVDAQKLMYERGNFYISNDQLPIRTNGVLEKKQVFRAVMMNPYTTKEDVKGAWNEVQHCVNEVLTQYQNNTTNIPSPIGGK